MLLADFLGEQCLLEDVGFVGMEKDAQPPLCFHRFISLDAHSRIHPSALTVDSKKARNDILQARMFCSAPGLHRRCLLVFVRVRMQASRLVRQSTIAGSSKHELLGCVLLRKGRGQ